MPRAHARRSRVTHDEIVTSQARVYVVTSGSASAWRSRVVRRAISVSPSAPHETEGSQRGYVNTVLDRKSDLVSNTPRLRESRIMSKNEDTLVLVADDEPSMLALLSAYIRSKGYRVLE